MCTATTNRKRACKNQALDRGKCAAHTPKVTCAICLEERVLRSTGVCSHAFCKKCLPRISRCAVCRADFSQRFALFAMLAANAAANAALNNPPSMASAVVLWVFLFLKNDIFVSTHDAMPAIRRFVRF